MEPLDCIKTVDLTQHSKLEMAKNVFESEEWREYLDAARKDLKKRKELNSELKGLLSKIRKAIELLWDDPLISFAKSIYHDEDVKDMSDVKIEAMIAERNAEIRENKKKRIALGTIYPVSFGILCAGMALFITTAHGLTTVLGLILVGIGEIALFLRYVVIGRDFYCLTPYSQEEIRKMRNVVAIMRLVKETEQYKAIMELENFEQLLEHEIELCSWPPI